MKKTNLSLTINTIVLCTSILVVWASIPTDLAVEDHIQGQIQQGIGHIDHFPSQEQVETNLIPTENHEDNPDLATHLNDIENFLMKDENFEVPKYLINHPEFDTTSNWNDRSEKRKRVKMTKSIGFLDSKSIPIESHQKSTSRADPEENQIYTSSLNVNPKGLSVHESTEKQKNKTEFTRVRNSAHHSQSSSYAKLNSQDSKNLSKRKSKEKSFFYSQLHFRSIASLLILKGELTMWYHPKLLKQIDDFFLKLNKHPYLTLFSSLNPLYTSEKVILAIKRVRKDVVIAYFGGLSIVFQDSLKEISIEEAYQIGWDYLKTYLNEAFDFSLKALSKCSLFSKTTEQNFLSQFRPPWDLMNYILNLEKYSPVRPSLIEDLMENFLRESIFQTLQHQIEFSTHSFISKILTEADLRGKKILVPSRCKPKETNLKTNIDFSTSIIPNSLDLDETRVQRLISKDPTTYLVRIGKHVLRNHMEFTQDVKSFLKILEKDMKQSLVDGINSMGGRSKLDHSNSMMIDLSRINSLITSVENSMMPAFLGMIIVLHQDQETEQVMEILLKTSWDSLKAYLSPWRTHFSENTSSITLNQEAKGTNSVDWFTPKDTIQHLSLFPNKIPIEPLWFLYELWYGTMIQKSSNWAQILALDFEPSPPNRDLNQKILSCFK
ncbi:hypothetical protein DFH28DRAFT_1018542, partial [Melampsora americana]